MARYSPEHKEQVRARIVAEAAQSFRERGLDGIGIQALMRRLGLTHGGFYRHFSDRDELVVEALRAAVQDAEQRLYAPLEEGGVEVGAALPARDFIHRYLSRSHRDHPEQGCPVAAVGAEATRQPTSVRRALSSAALRLLSNLGSALGRDVDARKGSMPDDRTLSVACVLVGALVLARSLGGGEQSHRVLVAGRRLAEQLASD